MFGGSKNTFGQPSTGAFSGFGQSAFAKPANTFGANTFGQQPNQSVFGAQPQSAGLFGASTAATTPQANFGSSFGQQTSIFGNTSTTGTTSLFGSQQQTSAFNAPKQQIFGQPQQPATSLFGQPQQPQQTSLFGQTPTNTGTGLFSSTPSAFGQPTTSNQQGGTAIAKFQAQQETDALLKGTTTSYIQTKQQCITFMKEYADKSLEELRIEDYAANRKGPQPASSGLFGGGNQSFFGANQTSTSTGGFTGFGQQSTAQPIFGQTNTNTLGTTSAFGQTNASFNQPGGGLFGKPLQTPSTTASAFGGFGTNTSTFGVAKPFNATAPTGNLFGASTPAAGGFGQPAANAFGASTFGQPQQQTSSLFGASSSTAPPAWNAGTSTTSTGFNTNASTGLFGANAAKPAFGATPFGSTPSAFGTTQTPASTGFNFGQSNPAGGGNLFGQKPATNLFGQPAAQPSASISFGGATGSSLFGNTTQPTGGGLFGTTPAQNNTNSGGLFGQSSTNTFGTGLGLSFGQNQPSLFNTAQPSMQQQSSGGEIHQKILALTSNPYGDNELFKGLPPASTPSEAFKPTNPLAQKALLESSSNFKISPNTSVSKLKVKAVSAVVTKKSLFDGLEEYDASLEESFTIKTSAKRLIIKPRASIDASKTNHESLLKIHDDSKIVEKENVPETFQNQIPISPFVDNNVDQDSDRRVSWLRTAPQNIRARPNIRDQAADTTISQLIQTSHKDTEAIKDKFETSVTNTSLLNETFNSNADDMQNEADISVYTANVEPHPTGIVLRRVGYYTIPSLDELIEYIDEEARCKVPNFTIGRRGYGNVYFDEEIDVAGLNLDEICHFRNKEIILYQDDDNKPPVGEGLNRKAQVTLDQIWPMDKTTHEPIKDPMRLEAMDYESKLRRICEKRNTKFLEYRPETGSCVFKVEHFSKYTLDDSDDEGADGEPRTDPKKARITSLTQNGKKVLNEKEKITADAQNDNNILRMKQQESTFILGPHAGQRGFQPNFTTSALNLDENFNPDPTSPSIKLAKEMQTDTHKLQLMKASFFVEDDAFSIMSDATEGRESPDQIFPGDFNRRSAFVSGTGLGKQFQIFDDGTVLPGQQDLQIEQFEKPNEPKRQELIQTIFKAAGPRSQPLIVRPRIMLFDVSDINLPVNESILNSMIKKQNNTIPFFHGRKFKMSWSHANEFTLLQSHASKSLFKGRLHDDISKSIVKISQIQSMSHKTNENFEKSLIEHLKIQLKYDAKISVDSSDCKYFEANGKAEALHEHFELSQKLSKDFPNEKNNYDATVWSLMESLWGYVDEMNMETLDHGTIMLRRDFFSQWLENVVTDNDVFKSNLDYLDRLINLMMCHKVNDACDLAFENNDINLSLLLAQSSGSLSAKQLLQHQLSCWHEVEADEFIDYRRLKILMIVSGISAMDGAQNKTLNIFENLNWLKCLALQLWYVSSLVSSVTDAIVAYEQNYQNVNANVANPVPPYCSAKDASKCKYYDLRFHLLKLYSQRSHALEVLLNPANYSKDLMDYRLSFLVLQVLETLGYRHISEACRLKIYTCLAEQLETNNLWEWSIWIMLHISNKNHRESAIQKLLYRYIKIDDERDDNYSAKEKFIQEELEIPEKWICWAKAVRARVLNNHQVELKYLLKAQHWTEAHDVLMNHIAPDLFINDQIDYLKSLLKQFESTSEIQRWKTQGEILLNFIELNESFSSLNNAENIDADQFLQRLSPLLSELCSNIKLFPCPTSKHRLCQCEIAKQLSFIIRNFYATSNAYGNQAFSMIRTALEKLPLPQEYAQQELRYVLTTFLLERLNTN